MNVFLLSYSLIIKDFEVTEKTEGSIKAYAAKIPEICISCGGSKDKFYSLPILDKCPSKKFLIPRGKSALILIKNTML